eukprot:TRINITY_DN15770_c0_g1_i1.p1 TRINITY_DN15770_c0_g1~~TRINITY_DN15770_c0_g1_i1.p1  ORF type:complete len:344 (-),score=39.70 TRINITY_DN15770_c0_g1_i1:301-1332(-)
MRRISPETVGTSLLLRLTVGDFLTKVFVYGRDYVVGTVQGYVFLIQSSGESDAVLQRIHEPIMLLASAGEGVTGVYLDDEVVSASIGDRCVVIWNLKDLQTVAKRSEAKPKIIQFSEKHSTELCSRTLVYQNQSECLMVTRASEVAIKFCLKTGSIKRIRFEVPLHIQSIPLFYSGDQFHVWKAKGDPTLQARFSSEMRQKEPNYRIFSGDQFKGRKDLLIHGDSCFTPDPTLSLIYSFDSATKSLLRFDMSNSVTSSFPWARGLIIAMRFCGDRLVIFDSEAGLSIMTTTGTMQTYSIGRGFLDVGDASMADLHWFPRGSGGILLVSAGHILARVTGLDWTV